MDDLRLLLTRPLADSRRFLLACEAEHGGPIAAVLVPLMEIVPLDPGPLPRATALILSSRHGATRARDLGLGGLPAWCVGPATAGAHAGPVLGVLPDAEALVARLLALRPPGPLLHLRGVHGTGDVAVRLRTGGLDAVEAVAYRAAALPPTPEGRRALDGPAPLLAPLFSPRSAALLAAERPQAPLHVVALSAAVADAARALGPESLAVADAPDAAALRRAVLRKLGASA